MTEPVAPPRAPPSVVSTLLDVVAAAAFLVFALAATCYVAYLSESDFWATATAVALFVPALMWIVRRREAALFYGLRAAAIAIPLFVVAGAAAPWAWRKLVPKPAPAAPLVIRSAGRITIDNRVVVVTDADGTSRVLSTSGIEGIDPATPAPDGTVLPR